MSKTTILVVEDEGIVAMELARKLEQLGYEVAGTAERGEEAVALAARLRPDLVLMDILLIGAMDGIDTAEAICRDQDVPVVYLTAHSDPATLARAKLTGPFGYILKPFELRDLATQIEMALYRHQADRQVRQQREWLRVTLASIGDAVIATDAEGQIVFMNPVAEGLTGWKAEAASGQPIQSVFRVVNEQTGLPLEEPVARVLRERRGVELVNHAALVTKDGRTVPIEDSAAPILDGAGQVVGVVLVFHDVTEKRRAEEALRQAEQHRKVAEAVRIERERFNTVLDMLPAYVVLLAPDYRVPFANRFFEDRFGKSEGRRCYEYLFHRTEPCENCETYKVLKTGSPHRWEWTGPDGRNYDIYDFPFTDMDGSPLVMEVGLDITEIKLAEAALKELNDNLEQRVVERTEALRHAKASAESANVAKSQFLTNMSHELRTPMNAILGMIDVALPKAVDPTVQDCLRTAKGSADLLLTLLNDLLDSAKIESGKLELESASFSLRRMLDQITRVLAVRASEKGLIFSCRVPETTPDAVIGDRMRLQQVLLNLAGNALKFTERGDVEIGLHACLQDGEASLEFAVRDTGIGIPPSGLERLFQPFGQADASMSRRFGGTGLGLSICKNLVERMGGRIWAESEVGNGSTFHFTVRLPLAKELPPDFEAPVALPTATCGQLRVLLVEDNPANQKLATYILQDRGHVVEIAGDGQEALCLTEQNRYDVILMDVQMPGMNGLEATAAIRTRENSGSRVPIIAMTAHAMKGDRDRCLAAGMDGYLSKPIQAQELIGLVESLACNASGVAAREGLRAPVTENQWLAAGMNHYRSKPITADELISTVERLADKPPRPQARPPIEAPSHDGTTVQSTPASVFDFVEAQKKCCGKHSLFQDIVACLFNDAGPLLEQMRTALAKGDAAEMGAAAHRLKGTVVYLGARSVLEATERVEQLGRAGDLLVAADAIRQLAGQVDLLKQAIAIHQRAAEA